MTSEEVAFRAGWMAMSRYEHHEWGPAPPDNPKHAYMKWKGIPLPSPTDKQESFMRSLGIWSSDCEHITVKEAANKISAEVNRRNETKRAYLKARDEVGDYDMDDYDYAVQDVMIWGYDD